MINEDCVTRLVILLRIVMVIPGRHESLSRTNESQFKKQRVQSSKCLGLSCIQTVNVKADSKTLYYSVLKLTYSPPSLLKSQEKRNGHNNCYRNHSNRIIYQNIHLDRSIDRSLRVACRELISILGDFMRQGRGTQKLVSLKVNLRRPPFLLFVSFFSVFFFFARHSTLQGQPYLRALDFLHILVLLLY